MCYELASGNLLHLPNKYGACNRPQPIESEPKHIQDALLLLLPGVNQYTKVSHSTWVKVVGTTIKKAAYVITGYVGHFPILKKLLTY